MKGSNIGSSFVFPLSLPSSMALPPLVPDPIAGGLLASNSSSYNLLTASFAGSTPSSHPTYNKCCISSSVIVSLLRSLSEGPLFNLASANSNLLASASSRLLASASSHLLASASSHLLASASTQLRWPLPILAQLAFANPKTLIFFGSLTKKIPYMAAVNLSLFPQADLPYNAPLYL